MICRPHRLRCARKPRPAAGVLLLRAAAPGLAMGLAMGLAAGLVISPTGTAWAQTATPGPSLDELLGLEPDPAPVELPADPAIDEASVPAADRATDPAAPNEAAGQPIADAAAQMEQAALRLDTSADAGLVTQRLQEDVLARLDQLITEAINNAAPPPPGGSGQGSGSGKPDNGDAQPGQGQGNEDAPGEESQGGKPSAGGGSSASPGGFSPGQVQGASGPEARPLRELRTEWGTLPPRLRDELSSGLDEPFSPVYRRQTEAFYRRLAQDAAQ